MLSAKFYGMAYGFNNKAVINTILGKIFRSAIPLVLCIDSKFLYKCLVKLGTTQEKQQMVDVMSLWQLQKRQKISKVKWIYGHHNLANSMTKTKPSSALKILIDTNCININTTKQVKWESIKQKNTAI